MSALDDIAKRISSAFRQTAEEGPPATGRVTKVSGKKEQSPYRSRTFDALKQLRDMQEESEAINFLKRVNPDVSMAVWNFIRLSNMGHQMEFYKKDGKGKDTSLESRWEEFASRINDVSNSGLDGLIDILHQMAFIRGAQAIEVEVAKDRKSIKDVHPIIPQSIKWKLEERSGREVWIPYQTQSFKEVSLEKANFYWVPTDPDPDDPRGNLIMAPVLQSVDFQMQIMQDLAAVLHHQGWPRNDIVINLERIMTIMPPEVKSGRTSINKWLNSKYQEIRDQLNNLEPDSDYVHFDDITINMNQGANASRSLDVRAIAELVDIQTMSGSKQMGIFMNRNSGVTETWGSVQFMIYCNGIASIQRGSKRLMEEVARLWLRVEGIQATPKFTHNKIDWQNEEQKAQAKLLWQEFWAVAQLMGWVDKDKAAQEGADVEKATTDPIENARVSFQRGGDSKDEKKAASDNKNVRIMQSGDDSNQPIRS